MCGLDDNPPVGMHNPGALGGDGVSHDAGHFALDRHGWQLSHNPVLVQDSAALGDTIIKLYLPGDTLTCPRPSPSSLFAPLR
jgi:hypothetical protein